MFKDCFAGWVPTLESQRYGLDNVVEEGLFRGVVVIGVDETAALVDELKVDEGGRIEAAGFGGGGHDGMDGEGWKDIGAY